MKALLLASDGRSLQLGHTSPPTVQHPDDVAVTVVQTGICGTDRSVLVGKFAAKPGTIMGHEAVGIVAEIGPAVSTVAVGDRVVINPTLFCGHCTSCRRGQFNHCLHKDGNEVGIDRHGSFAETIVIPQVFVNPIPDDVSTDRATLFEPLCCALSNVDAAGVQPGQHALILGGGPIGALAAIAASVAGATTTIIESDATRRDLLNEAFAHADMPTVHIAGTDYLTGSPQADIAIDAVGTLLETAIAALHANGTAVAMGYNDQCTAKISPLDVLFRGLRIVGAGDYNFPLFQRAVDLGSRLPLEALITHKFSLESHQDAFALLSPRRGQPYSALKIVLTTN